MSKQDKTTLQTALINMGRTQIDFHNSGEQYPVEVESLPDESLLRIFDYGKRMFNDYVNSAKNQGKEAGTAAEEWLTKARKGELGTRQGGARISPLKKALRGLVVEYLKAAGWDAKQAQKDAKEPSKAFREMLGVQIARGKGIPLAEVDDETIEAAMDKNWPMVEAKAQAIVDAQQGGLTLDI